MSLNMKERLAKSASLQKEQTAPAGGNTRVPEAPKKERIPDYNDKVKELEKKLMLLEKENLNLKNNGNSKISKWDSYKRITVGVETEDYEAFKEFIEKVGPIYQPNRLGTHKTSHNPYFRSLFSCLIARLDQINIDEIGSEEDIYNEVNKLFK